MHRSGLIALACAASLVACKSKSEDPRVDKSTKAVQKSERAKTSPVLDVPSDVVYAGSAHLRVVDVAMGQVVAGVQIQRNITSMAFSKDGTTAYLACSDGVREIDAETHREVAKLTQFPARRVMISSDGDHLFVLEHEVKIEENGTRVPQPFRLVTIDRKSRKILSSNQVGPRILSMLPSEVVGQHHVIVEEGGKIRLPSSDSLAGGEAVDVDATGKPNTSHLIRPYMTWSADRRLAYVPVEGDPSRVLEIDRQTKRVRALSLGESVLLRGLAVSADGKTLVANASTKAFVLDLGSGEVRASIALDAAHIGVSFSTDQKRVYLAQTVDGTGGALTVLRLDPIKIQGKIHLKDISPWVLAVRPRAELATR